MELSKVIVALDFENKNQALEFLNKFENPIWVKVGMQLFYKEGPSIIEDIKKLGHKIFLDLKLHDIPNTVEKAMSSIKHLGVDMTNCHAAGGIDMMKAARKGFGTDGILIAVTQLTSTSKEVMNNELLINGEIDSVVKQWSENAVTAGLDGIVCSAMESNMVNCLTVTPGIRLESDAKDDQVRVMTPAKAKENGANYIVVGRPIRNASNPVEAYKTFVKEFN